MLERQIERLDGLTLARNLEVEIGSGRSGPPLTPDEVIVQAWGLASARNSPKVFESDLIRALLQLTQADPKLQTLIEHSLRPPGEPRVEESAPTADETGVGSYPTEDDMGKELAPGWDRVRPGPRDDAAASGSRTATPALDRFGRDLTALARQGRLGSFTGREAEVGLVIETMCRRASRNPVLIGPAGVGKTAIVEGLARRIVEGRVPEMLRDIRLVEIQPWSLVAGAKYNGEVEERVKRIVTEASQPGIALFVDEMHSLIGAGGPPGLSDVASQLKPALARGSLACIGATTDVEYRRFVEEDRAFERRFQPIHVQEPTRQETEEILASMAVDIEKSDGILVPREICAHIVDFAGQFLLNRAFPAKAVDLLDQCVAHARVNGANAVTLESAEAVGRRIVGMPTDVNERITRAGERLRSLGLMADEDLTAFINRLEVTLRGLDVRQHRPNAILLLTGDAVDGSHALCEAIAEALFGSARRIVAIDFGRFLRDEDLTMLTGSPRGYVGYAQPLPIHGLLEMPWCVFRADNLHSCHPKVLDVLTQALESGYFTDSTGRRVHLRDTIVVLTAPVDMRGTETLGFRSDRHDSARHENPLRTAVAAAVGARLLAQCDLSLNRMGGPGSGTGEQELLDQLGERYGRHGLRLEWDPSLLQWLKALRHEYPQRLDWERQVDQVLGPALVAHLRRNLQGEASRLRVGMREGAVRIEVVHALREEDRR
ncbi:MAG: hypothetical protein A2W00_04910 [Candidatus Eisenbacteria bacterium RBG_16_71_46]|nr:MAG: hypothetical protein A2W00_04910 [Candidatus Eisenbacteria bacterium RBG_16_71_46]